MGPEEQTSNRTHALVRVLETGNFDLTVREGKRLLASEPENETAHYCLAAAYIQLNQAKLADFHTRQLLRIAPNEASSHIIAANYYRSYEDLKKLRYHSQIGLKLDPEEHVFYYFLAIADTIDLKTKSAQRFIQLALELAPENTDYQNLSIRLSAIEDGSSEGAWRRVRELEDALSIDPENAYLHNSLGDILLNELGDAKSAEQHYRNALRIRPSERQFQKDLFHSVARRDLLYLLVSIPSRTFSVLGNLLYTIKKRPSRIIFVVIGIKPLLLFLGWLSVATVVFWPAGRIYEWLLVSEIKSGADASVIQLRVWRAFQRWPRWLRFGLFTTVWLVFCALVFWSFHIPLGSGFLILSVFIAVHFLIVAFVWAFRGWRRTYGKRRADRAASTQQSSDSS